MPRFMTLACLACLALLPQTLHGATVETTLFGPLNGPPPIVGGDGQGNLVLVTQLSCSVFQVCQPFSIVKLDATGKVLLRQAFGDSSWRLQVRAVALDRAGNIILGGTTEDPNLPVVRAIRTQLAGQNDAYVMQLSPDASRVLFATYLGGSGLEDLRSLAVDAAGNLAAVVLTGSPDFPFTANATQASQQLPRYAIVRLTTSALAPRLAYALALPSSNPPPELSVSADGTVVASVPISDAPDVRQELIEIRPDGAFRRVGIPLPGEARTARALPASDGGFWITGTTAAGALTTTPNAWRSNPVSFSYLRWEGPQSITPPGPIRSLTVRLLEVDRADGNRLYAATTSGLARTENNGWTWEIVNDTPALRRVRAMATSASTTGNRLWVLVPENNVAQNSRPPDVLYSDDRGVTFNSLPTPSETRPTFIAVDPTDRQVLSVVANTTLYTTRDAGQTWAQRRFLIPISNVIADGKTIAVITSEFGGRFGPMIYALEWSDDGGESFQKPVPLPSNANGLRFDPSEPGTLYFLSNGRLVRTQRETLPNLEELPVPPIPLAHFGFQPGVPGVLLALAVDGRGLRSADGGRSWQALAPSLALPAQGVSQWSVGAGGVIHVVLPAPTEGFFGKVTATGELSYLTYLGTSSPFSHSLQFTNSGQVLLTGQMNGSALFPGERLRNPSLQFPPDLSTNADIFAIAFQPDASFVYAAAIAGIGPDTLWWSGPGTGSSVLLFGQSQSQDFPGIGVPGNGNPGIFLARLRP